MQGKHHISGTNMQLREGLLTLLSSKSTNNCIIDTKTKPATANSNHLSNDNRHKHTKLAHYQHNGFYLQQN